MRNSGTGFYHFLVFGERKVVLAKGHNKDDGSDALKAVDPLFAFRPLTTNVEHSVASNTHIAIISNTL